MSPMALPCFANDISTEGRRAPKAPEHPGIRSPLNKLTVYKCQRAERRCAMGRSAGRQPTQQHGGRHGGVVGGESEESAVFSNRCAHNGGPVCLGNGPLLQDPPPKRGQRTRGLWRDEGPASPAPEPRATPPALRVGMRPRAGRDPPPTTPPGPGPPGSLL